ncbi:MAG TPA: PaaI family thioesterase [Candidatus Binatia bacterium]|nr:PaaI family thioesterase [Candidatus Binatia bacterium]
MSSVLDAIGARKHMLIDYVPHARALGLSVVDAKPGEAWLRVPYAEHLVGNTETGVIHGGVITTLLDNCAGVAVMTALDELKSIATLDLRIDYMKPATPGLDVIGYCRCYKVTRNVAFVHGSAYHADPDDPIATTAMTFMLGANRTLPAVSAEARRSRGEGH